MLKNTSCLILLLFMSFYSFSDVSVIGITINKDTMEDVEKIYRIDAKQGNLWRLNINEISIDGAKQAEVIFEDNCVKGVWLVVDDNRFDYLFNALKNKYKIIKKETPFVGNKYASFEKENVLIWVSAPHMSFVMDLVYMDKKYKTKFESKANKSIQEKIANELKQL